MKRLRPKHLKHFSRREQTPDFPKIIRPFRKFHGAFFSVSLISLLESNLTLPGFLSRFLGGLLKDLLTLLV